MSLQMNKEAPGGGDLLAIEDAWVRLRQGARNVAGVSWQIEVTTHMLVLGRCGFSTWTHFTPEGIEDVDCRDANGLTTYVQMKEVRAGKGRMTAKNIADAMSHANVHAEGRPIVIVTDGELGSDLSFTGWDADMLTQASHGLPAVRQHLLLIGIPEEEVDKLLGKTSLVRLPWDLRPKTERLLVDNLGVHPAVSGIAISRLNGLMSVASANQRSTTAETAHSLSVVDVDAILAEVQSTVDLDGLDRAISSGVCTPARYVEASTLTTSQFLLGREGTPSIVSAGLDVVRHREMQEVLEGLNSQNYTLLMGPSGAGKSVLLWRAARDIFVGASVWRVLRVSTPDDVEMLARHVALQRPSRTAPLVVAGDNLGRPHMGAWPDAVRRLREVPWVFMLGAVRNEDFSPRLVSGGAAIVELALDSETAADIASAVQEAGIDIRIAPEEAESRAEGLLMEYLALLTAGRRFRDVIAEQVENLRAPERKIERTLARWVTSAHAIGLGVEAEVLTSLLEEHDDIVGDALNRLRGEYVVLKSEAEWRGLHELRSATISELLHESPPPTLAQTYAQIAHAVALPLAGWFLRRIAQEAPGAVIAAAHSVSDRLASTDDPNVISSALEGAERADSLLYAARSLPILRQRIPRVMTVHDAAMFVYSIANHGFSFGQTGIEGLADGMAKMSRIAEEIGPRSAVVTQAVARTITGKEIVRLTADADQESTARLLEACHDVVGISPAEAGEIYSRLPRPETAACASIHARIISSLCALAGLENDEVTSVFGSLEARVNMLTWSEPWALTVEINGSDEGIVVSVKVLCPNSEENVSVTTAWDPTQRPSSDPVNEQATRIAKRIAEGCPDADIVEIRTLGPSGSPYTLGDFEPGYKRLTRSVLPRRDTVRRSISFQAALRRLDASSSWTDLVRQQVMIASELARLLEQGCGRLSSTDNSARRREWKSGVEAVARAVASLKARPVAVAVDPDASHAQSDQNERDHDPLTRVYEAVIRVLQDLPEQRFPSGIALSIEAAIASVEKAQRDGFPTLGSVGTPLPASLKAALARLLDLQRAVAAWPAAAQQIRTRPESVDEVIGRVVEATQNRESALLETVMADHADYRIIRARSKEPRPNTVDGCDLVLVAELSEINNIVGRLNSAKDALRDGLTAWVYVVVTREGLALPVMLRLTAYGSSSFLPVPPEKRNSLLEAAGLEPAPRGFAEEVDGILEEVGGRSFLAALRHMREKSWSSVIPPGTIRQRDYPALRNLGSDEIAVPLLKLREQVAAEEKGVRPPGQLAGAFLQTVSGVPLDDDQEALLRTVLAASLIGFE